MELQEAYELAVKKWQWIVDHNGDDDGLVQAIPELRNFEGNCSYCELFNRTEETPQHCEGCPLFANGDWCIQSDSSYDRWRYGFYFEEDTLLDLAKRMLEQIKKFKPV